MRINLYEIFGFLMLIPVTRHYAWYALLANPVSLDAYIQHLKSNPDQIPNGKSAAEVVAHAKSLGHDVSHDDLEAYAKKDGKFDSAGGGCYAQGDNIVGGI